MWTAQGILQRDMEVVHIDELFPRHSQENDPMVYKQVIGWTQ